MADGRFDRPLLEAAEELAKWAILFDLARPRSAGSVINAVLFGARGRLRRPAARREAPRRRSAARARAVEANLRGFAAGFACGAAS